MPFQTISDENVCVDTMFCRRSSLCASCATEAFLEIAKLTSATINARAACKVRMQLFVSVSFVLKIRLACEVAEGPSCKVDAMGHCICFHVSGSSHPFVCFWVITFVFCVWMQQNLFAGWASGPPFRVAVMLNLSLMDVSNHMSAPDVYVGGAV